MPGFYPPGSSYLGQSGLQGGQTGSAYIEGDAIAEATAFQTHFAFATIVSSASAIALGNANFLVEGNNSGDAIAEASGGIPMQGEASIQGDAIVEAEGELIVMGSASIKGDAIAEAEATFIAFGEAHAIGTSVATADWIEIVVTTDKQYVYKIYDGSGNFLGRWEDVVSDFVYSQEINSAGSAVDVVLARTSDTIVPLLENITDDSDIDIETDDSDPIEAELSTANSIGPGTTVDLNLNVEVYVFPRGTSSITGQLIFTGYISKYTSQYGREENTTVTLFSYGADMDNWVLERSGDTRVPYNSVDTPSITDPSDILKDALDEFNLAGGIPSYDQGSTTIDDTTTAVSYTFNVNTMLEVVKKCLELAPTDWYWYYDMALNNVHFHDKGSTPDHTFVLGRHILDFRLEKYIEDITNSVYFTGGDNEEDPGNTLFLKKEDATSISNYRRGVQRITDNRVTLDDSAEIIVDGLLGRASEPRYRSSIRISDSVYPIESIRLGELVTFKNFGNFIDQTPLIMQIVRIDYTPDYVQLQLDTLLPSVPKRLEDIKRNLNQSDYAGNPDAPASL